MTDIATVLPHAEIVAADDLAALSSAELRAHLADALTLTASNLVRAAAIWQELQRRDEPLPALQSGIGSWLPRIARGLLAAEAVIAFADQRMLLSRMIGMPLDQQRLLASGEEIIVAAINARGEVVGEAKPLARLNSREVLMAIDSGEVRPIAAQIKTMMHTMTRAKKTAHRARSGYSTATIRGDAQTGTITIGRSRIAPSDLTDALRALGYVLMRTRDDV